MSSIHAQLKAFKISKDINDEFQAIDAKKAFDSLSQNAIIETLKQMNISGYTLALVRYTLNLYYLFEPQTQMEIKNRNGIPQGSKCAPILYLITQARILRDWKRKYKYSN